MSKEWTAAPDKNIEVPREIKKRLKYKIVYNLAGATLTGYFRSFKVSGPRLQLRDALLDTSERHMGIVLKKRFSFWSEIILLNTQVEIIKLDESPL